MTHTPLPSFPRAPLPFCLLLLGVPEGQPVSLPASELLGLCASLTTALKAKVATTGGGAAWCSRPARGGGGGEGRERECELEGHICL